MALFTREDARESARVAKKAGDYFVVVGINEGFTSILTRTYPLKKYTPKEVTDVFKRELNVTAYVIHSDAIKRKFPKATTIKDLETILYRLVNAKIRSVYEERLGTGKRDGKKKEKVDDILLGVRYTIADKEPDIVEDKEEREEPKPEELVIYKANVGYNSVAFRFYVKVRETDKSIWLQQIGKHRLGSDWQNPQVRPNPSEEIGEVFRRNKNNGSIKIGEYEYATLWDGSTLQEYSD